MNSPAFQFYPQDFLVGTADLSPEEVGGYIRLLCYQWAKGGLPNDDAKLASMSGCHGNAVASIRHKFRIYPDGILRNERLEKVRDDQTAFRAKQADNAKRGWNKRLGIATALPEHMPDTCSSSSSSSSNSVTVKESVCRQDEAISHGKTLVPPCPEMWCLKWWEDCERRGWVDREQIPIRKWKPALSSYWRGVQENDRRTNAMKGKSNGSHLQPVDDYAPAPISKESATIDLQAMMREAKKKREQEENGCR
jgi:uncharacterized protein YdaU (DUF1376 family)